MPGAATASWDSLATNRVARVQRVGSTTRGKVVAPSHVVELLEAVIENGDKVCVEGNNQKHADFLSQCLAKVDPARVSGLHIVQSNIALASHLDVFDKGIARTLDFCYSGEQGVRLGKLVKQGRVTIGAIHTYLELYSRYFVDLTPRVSLIAAQSADAEGNLFTGPNTEDTPAVVEATAFKNGIVIAQVNEIVGYTFDVDPKTFNKPFKLEVDGGAGMDISFYADLGDITDPTTAPANVPFATAGPGGESGLVPKGYPIAFVCMTEGAEAAFTYTAGKGVK